MSKTIGIILSLKDKFSPRIKTIAEKLDITINQAKKLDRAYQTICRTPLIPPKHRNSNKKHLTFRNNPTFRQTGKNGISTVLKTNSLIIPDPSNALNKPTLPNNPTI